MNPLDADYVVFDVETTGLSPLSGDRIIEIAAVKLKKGKIVNRFESFVNPERSIPAEATNVNNITNEMVADAPIASEVLPTMIDFIGGACLVAHNIKFDMDFLCFQLAQAGRRLHDGTPGIDTLKLSRRFLPQLGSHKLSNLAQFYGLDTEGAHRALADVEMTASIFNNLLDMAHDQGFTAFAQIHKDFGVNKPNFKIEKAESASLF